MKREGVEDRLDVGELKMNWEWNKELKTDWE